jgi:hypothetical protein
MIALLQQYGHQVPTRPVGLRGAALEVVDVAVLGVA